MARKERVLTAREEKRKAEFAVTSEMLTARGYERKDLTVSVVQANLGALLMTPFCLIGAFLYLEKYGFSRCVVRFDTWLAFFVGSLALCVVHELIHGICWGIFAENHRKSIEFGIIWSMLTPYCPCRDPLKKGQYIFGGVMPTVMLGFGLTAVSIVTGSFFLFLLGEAMFLGGGGDFLILLLILRRAPKSQEVLFLDHPYECGVVMFIK